MKRMSDAWRTPVRDVTIDPDEGDALVRAIEKAIEGVTDPDAAGAREREVENWQGRPIAELTADVEKRRAVAHSRFSQDLSNAWRSA